MNIQEYPLYYPTTPATLQELATTKLALDICRSNRFTPIDMLSRSSDQQFSRQEIIGPVASSIKVMINKRIRSIGRELENLFEYLMSERRGIFFGTDYISTFTRCFDSFTYGPDGTICSERTARNLLTNDNVTLLEKYKIACTYCFEDDVRRIWPTVSAIPKINVPDSVKDPLLNYWSSRMKNDKYKPSMGLLIILNGLHAKFHNWTAFKYMLNETCVDDQLNFINNIFRTGKLAEFEYVLPKLNNAHAIRVLQEYPDRIIFEFASKEKYLEYMFRIWTLVKESIKYEQFYHLLSALCCDTFTYRDATIDPIVLPFRHPHRRILRAPPRPAGSGYKKPPKESIIYEIWLSAPHTLKSTFIENDVEKFFIDLGAFDSKNGMKYHDYEMRFFSLLLTSMSFESRDRIWRAYWLVFVIRSRPKYLPNFLRLCLQNQRDIDEFVENEMMTYSEVGNYIEFLLRRQLYEDVIDYTNLCSSNERLAGAFRRQVVTSSARLLSGRKFDKLIELSEFIDGSFTNVDETREFKEHLYYSDRFQNILAFKMKNGLTDEVMHLTGIYLYSEQSYHPNLIAIKQEFLKYWQNYILIKTPVDKFDFMRWKEFLCWCGYDQNNSNGFRQSLPVDTIFQTMVVNAVSNLSLWLGPLETKRIEHVPSSARKLVEFADIDEFLAWYFITSKAVKDYKLSKICNFQEMERVKYILRVDNECVVNDVLRWFFDENRDEIDYFKECVLKR